MQCSRRPVPTSDDTDLFIMPSPYLIGTCAILRPRLIEVLLLPGEGQVSRRLAVSSAWAGPASWHP